MIVRGIVSAEPAAAMRECGFTPRQARFLMLVLEHSGVCLPPAFALRFGGQAGSTGRSVALLTVGRRTASSPS